MANQTEEKIRLRAYEIWDREGRPEGHDLDHWLRAQHELGIVPPEAVDDQESGSYAIETDDPIVSDITRLSAGNGNAKRSQAAG